MISKNYTDGLEIRIAELQQRNAELAAQVERLTNELVLSTDQNDMVLDEFVRIKLLTDNKEIHALCERANLRMRQKVSVIDRNMMLEQKLISAKRDMQELFAQVELLQLFLMQVNHREPEIAIPDFLMKTGQCLAEHDRRVAARVVEKVIEECQKQLNWQQTTHYKTVECFRFMNEYANKIKSGEVEI